MPKIKIIRYKPKHPILFIKSLMQVVTNYLQYEEASEVYEYFQVEKPSRPMVELSKEWKVDPNVNIWYIPYERGFHVTEKDLDKFLKVEKIMWECPNCLEFQPLNIKEINHGIKFPIIQVFEIDMQVPELENICRTNFFICCCILKNKNGDQSLNIEESWKTLGGWRGIYSVDGPFSLHYMKAENPELFCEYFK